MSRRTEVLHGAVHDVLIKGRTVAMTHQVRPGWAPFLTVGTRVTARYALPKEHEKKASDALGYIRAVDEDTITVETKRGFARIPRGLITAVKEVPPPPVRRRRR